MGCLDPWTRSGSGKTRCLAALTPRSRLTTCHCWWNSKWGTTGVQGEVGGVAQAAAVAHMAAAPTAAAEIYTVWPTQVADSWHTGPPILVQQPQSDTAAHQPLRSRPTAPHMHTLQHSPVNTAVRSYSPDPNLHSFQSHHCSSRHSTRPSGLAYTHTHTHRWITEHSHTDGSIHRQTDTPYSTD